MKSEADIDLKFSLYNVRSMGLIFTVEFSVLTEKDIMLKIKYLLGKIEAFCHMTIEGSPQIHPCAN